MLFFVKVRTEAKGMSLDDLWDSWEKEAEAALGAKAAGKAIAVQGLRAAARGGHSHC